MSVDTVERPTSPGSTEMQSVGGHVFVSYAHADKSYADTLANHLRDQRAELGAHLMSVDTVERPASPGGTEMQSVGGHVFVSYAHADKSYADTLANHLRDRGFDVWTDAAVVCGDKWKKAIQKKIDSCAAFVVVMSPAADESEWVEREVHHAQTQGKRIFPLLLSGAPLFAVNDLQYEDVQGGVMPSPQWEDHLRRTVNGTGTGPV